MSKKKLTGVGTALVTPFTDKGNIDYKAFEKLIDHNINHGIHYLVLHGTTGETVTLSKKERIESFNFAIEYINNRVPLVLGIGGNNTYELIKEFEWFDLKKVSAILSASPAYNKPSQKGIIEHYKVLAEYSPSPILLYNVPGRTCSNISAETTINLAKEVKNIIGIKEASGNLNQISYIIHNKPKDFLVISGDDALTLPILSLGGDGVISVLTNAFPKDFSKMIEYIWNEKLEKAQKIHHTYTQLIDLLFAENNPAGIKAALEIIGIGKANLRLPLVNISDALYKKIKEEIKKIQN